MTRGVTILTTISFLLIMLIVITVPYACGANVETWPAAPKIEPHPEYDPHDPDDGAEQWDAAAAVSCPDSASVTCGAGYYSCCWTTRDGCPRARCQAVGSDDRYCMAGGEGSTSCQIDKDTGEDESPVDPEPI